MSAPIDPAQFSTRLAPIERRERRPVHMTGHGVLPDGTTAPLTLLDLSYDGCGIAIDSELRPGDRIKISVLKRGAIPAEVRWYSQGKAGLVFATDAPAEPTHRPRQIERVCTTADVLLRRPGRFTYRVRLEDLSANGCKIEFVERPQQGERVWIKFEGLDRLEGEVCWIEHRSAGIQFVRHIHPAVFDLLLERLIQADARS
ncbi:MAG TPA: PilZ domain-containing protein [Sphingomicrobium sp.]|nr:PilZ domain-containing protein [Sphingomicrobium sp.]